MPTRSAELLMANLRLSGHLRLKEAATWGPRSVTSRKSSRGTDCLCGPIISSSATFAMTWTCPESMRMPRLGSLSLVPPHTTQHQDSSVYGFGTLSPPLPPRVAKRATDARNLSRFVREDDGRFQGMRQPTEIHFHQGARVRHQLGQRQRFDGPMVPAVRLGQGGGEVSQSAQGHLHTKRDIYTQKRKLSHNNRGRWQPANGD